MEKNGGLDDNDLSKNWKFPKSKKGLIIHIPRKKLIIILKIVYKQSK